MRRFKLLMAALAIALLSGCAKFEYGIVVESKENVSISASYLLPPVLSADMSENDFKQTFGESGIVPGREFTYEIIEEKVDDETWRGVKATAKLSEKEAAELVSGDANTIRLTVTREKFEEFFGDKNPIEENGLSELGTAESTEEIVEDEGLEIVEIEDATDEESSNDDFTQLAALTEAAEHLSMVFKITMPKEPVTNIGEVEGNTVTINMMTEEYQNTPAIVITCDAPLSLQSNGVLIAGLIAGFLVFVGALAFVNKKYSN